MIGTRWSVGLLRPLRCPFLRSRRLWSPGPHIFGGQDPPESPLRTPL